MEKDSKAELAERMARHGLEQPCLAFYLHRALLKDKKRKAGFLLLISFQTSLSVNESVLTDCEIMEMIW